MDWRPPQWTTRHKHRPPRPALWDRIVVQTGQKGHPARYAPGLGPDELEEMEMGALRPGVGVELRTVGTKRRYYRAFDHVIGASNGQLVQHIFVEWHQGASVHGRPITVAELRQRKEADL